MTEELYCKIYLNALVSKDELLRKIADSCNGAVSVRTVEAALMVIDVVANDSADTNKSMAPDGYVYFPYYLEIEPREADGVDPKKYIAAIRDLCSMLQSQYGSKNVVAACDFEDHLSDV